MTPTVKTVVLDYDGSHLSIHGHLVSLDSFEEANVWDVYWGDEQVGTLSLCRPRQLGNKIGCSVFLWGDGYTTDSLQDMCRYLVDKHLEPAVEGAIAHIDQGPPRSTDLPDPLLDRLASMSFFDLKELWSSLVEARRHVEDAFPGIWEYIEAGNSPGIVKFIQSRTFTFDEVDTLFIKDGD